MTLDILGTPRAVLREHVLALGEAPFRTAQIFDAIHRRGVRGFDEITDLSRDLRHRLAEHFRIERPRVAALEEAIDGTRKFLFELTDGRSIETVDIPDRGRHTLCLSSQAGCALACRFCVTGFWGAGRDLTAGEIVGQVLAVRFGEPPLPPSLNLVFMGMGEPLLNLGAVRDAFEVLRESISPRRITLSTAGVIPGIEELGTWPVRPNLAVSLHAPDDERRSEIMPINRRHPLRELLAALAAYPLERGRRITIEYILLRDFNDSLADARALARLLRTIPSKINLIPANPDAVLGDRIVPPTRAGIVAFQEELAAQGYTVTVRRRRGDDVAAACGQLRAQERAPRGFRTGGASRLQVSW